MCARMKILGKMREPDLLERRGKPTRVENQRLYQLFDL